MSHLLQTLAGSIFASPAHYAASCGVLLAAQAIYVLFGFGAGLIAIGALALLLPRLGDAVVLLLFVGLPAELLVVGTSRRSIAWRGVALIGAGIAAGVPIGTALLARGDPRAVLVALGALLVALGLVFCGLREGVVVRWPGWSPPLVGLLAGVLSGLFGTGGPPLVLYYRLAGADKASFRGNLMAIFLVVTLLRLPSYAVAGLLTRPRLGAALLVLPAVLLGAWIGQRIHVGLSERRFAQAVGLALAAMGLLLLLRAR